MNNNLIQDTTDQNLFHQHIWNLIQNQSAEFNPTDILNLIKWNLIQETNKQASGI